MNRRFPILAAIATAGCVLGACAHATSTPPMQLGELGEDLADTPAAPVRYASVVSVDMPVGMVCNHPEARAVLDRDLPGLTTRPEYMFFKHMSLRQLKAASDGKMSQADFLKVSADLNALPIAGKTQSAKPPRRTLLVRIASILP